MRRIVYLLPLLLLLQVNTPSVGQTSAPLIDTAKINAMKDSIRVKLDQILDVELLSACLKVRQIECVGAITLLAPNEPLRDAIASFKEGYGTNVLVHSYISSNQLWPRLFFNASRMTSDIADPGVKPAVGFDVRFTPQGARGQRKYAVEVGNQATPELLTDAQRTQLTSATKRGLTGAFDGVNTAAVDSTNASLLNGIDQLRSFWEASLAQCNLKGVTFAPSANPKFGFDAMPSEALKGYYTRLTVRGRDYYAPWQSIAANASEEVAIQVELQDGNPPTHPVTFRSSTGKTPSVRSNGDNTYAVTLLGGSEGSEETIEAYYTDTLPGGRTKQIVIGALKVRAYAPAQRRVVPVILNRASLGVSPTALQETLNGIYQQAAVSWTVGEPISLTVNQSEWDTDERDGALLVETSPFNRYSSEMQAIIDRIKDLPTFDPEASYLIVTDLPNSMGYAGYMPLKSDFAFIFTQNDNEAYRIMAHELGHGAFYLKHPQDEYRILEGTDNLMDKYAVGKTLWKPQWDWIGDPSWRLYVFQEESEGAMMAAYPEYFEQSITQPNGKKVLIHQDAVCIQNDKDQTIAFLLPEGKTFYWVDGYGYFTEEGLEKKTEKYSYIGYVGDKYNRQAQPISWGIYLAASDLGGFAIDLATNPTETTTAFAKGLWKIATLQFDIEKTWQRIVNADATDVSYVAATVALAYLSGPKAKGLVAAEDAPKFREVLEEYAAKSRPQKLTWPELLDLFKKAKAFETAVTNHLKTLYPVSEGYTILKQIYVKVDGVISIADNIIYNSKTKQFILNETKYGITNTLRKNQQIIEDAVKAGKQLEIRSAGDILDASGGLIGRQGGTIKITKVLRSNSVDGTITSNTVKTTWP